jgi:hypothetical protein
MLRRYHDASNSQYKRPRHDSRSLVLRRDRLDSTAIGEPLYYEEFHFMSRLSILIIAPTYTSVRELRIAKREGKYSGGKLSLTPARATELRRRIADGDSKVSRIARSACDMRR